MNPEPRKNVSPVAVALSKQQSMPQSPALMQKALAQRPKLNSYQ